MSDTCGPVVYNKPRLRIVDGQPVPMSPLHRARAKFGRPFCYEQGSNYLRNPEPVLSRWARRADYYNLDPHQPRPAWASLHFKGAA